MSLQHNLFKAWNSPSHTDNKDVAQLATLPFVGDKRKTTNLALPNFIKGQKNLYSQIQAKEIEEVSNKTNTDVKTILATNRTSLESLRNSPFNREIFQMILDDLENPQISAIDDIIHDKSVRKKYIDEYSRRESSVERLYKGRLRIRKAGIRVIEKHLHQLEKHMLGHKIECHRNNTPINHVKLEKIRSVINILLAQKEKILEKMEPAMAHEFERIMDYREQYERTGYILTPSRQKIIDEVIEKMILGENILIAGSTGGGKTVLARKIIEILGDIENKIVLIDTTKLRQDIDSHTSFKEYLISGNSSLRVSDFIGKLILKEGEKGGTITGFELGKLLKAWKDGKTPIFDEIDLAPNDILMRVKHLFTLRPGDTYSPQEDGDTLVTLNKTGIIATANIKSEKHTDREELDNAILRLFHMINVSHLPESEMIDIAKAILVEKSGYIYGTGPEEFQYGEDDWDKSGKASVMYFLIKAISEIQDNYLGKNNIQNAGGMKKNLKKAIFELGNYISILRGFRFATGSKIYGDMNFNEYIMRRVVEFVTRPGYPKDDRLILIKIFSKKGLLTEDHIPLLLERMEDISESELQKELLTAQINFATSNTPFIDPYELSMIDPFGERKLEEKESCDEKIVSQLRLEQILQMLIESRKNLGSNEANKNHAEVVRNIIEGIIKTNNYASDSETIGLLIGSLYELGMYPAIQLLKDTIIPGIDRPITLLVDWESEHGINNFGKYISGDINSTHIVGALPQNPLILNTKKGFQTQELLFHNIISPRRKQFLENLKKNGKVAVEGGEIDALLSKEELDKISEKIIENLTVSSRKKLRLKESGYDQDIECDEIFFNNIPYIALQVPESLVGKKLRDTNIGKQLIQFEKEPWFIGSKFLDSVISDTYVFIAKESQGKDVQYGHLRDESCSSDYLRKCISQGGNLQIITQTILFSEILLGLFGSQALEYRGDATEPDNKEGLLAKQITKSTGINLYEFHNEKLYVGNLGLYVDNSGQIQGVVRGDSGKHARAGVCSLYLKHNPKVSISRFFYRPALF